MEAFTRAQCAHLAIFCMGLHHVSTSTGFFRSEVCAYCESEQEANKVRETLLHYQKENDSIVINHIQDSEGQFWSCELKVQLDNRFEDD